MIVFKKQIKWLVCSRTTCIFHERIDQFKCCHAFAMFSHKFKFSIPNTALAALLSKCTIKGTESCWGREEGSHSSRRHAGLATFRGPVLERGVGSRGLRRTKSAIERSRSRSWGIGLSIIWASASDRRRRRRFVTVPWLGAMYPEWRGFTAT